MGIAFSIDRSAEIHVDARIRINVDSPAAEPRVVLTSTMGGITVKWTGGQDMSYTLPGDKQVGLQIAYVDANGNPAPVDGAVQWESSTPEIADVVPISPLPPGAPEGGAVTLVPGTKTGNVQVSATADADLGSGISTITTLLDVTVVAGQAVAGTITPIGAPEPKP